jgi:mannose-6-phosphate isomerase
MRPSAAPYPLLLRPVFFEKVWGGRRLERLGKRLPPGRLIGESWEVADLPSTSPSGAGGAPVRSEIAGGPLAGRTLHDAMVMWGDDLLGGARPTPGGDFPLLVKFLDARENLSVQVHPSAAFARTHPGAYLKSECWFVLEAEPGSVIYKGVKQGVTRADFERALARGGEGVVELIESVPARPGECHALPSGTVHALGAGVVVAEVQTPGDTTYRVYDWGRVGRALHIPEAMECIEWAPAPRAVRLDERSALARTDGFTLEYSEPGGPVPVNSAQAPSVLTVLAGSAVLEQGTDQWIVDLGGTVVIPSTVDLRLLPGPRTRLLWVRVDSGP